MTPKPDVNAATWPEPTMSHALIGSLSRVVMNGEGQVTLDLHECRAILALDTAANETVGFLAPKIKRDDEISRPLVKLRKAVRRV